MTKLQIEDILVVVAKRNTISLSKNRQLAQKIYKLEQSIKKEET